MTLPAYEQGTQYLALSPIRSRWPWSRHAAGCTRVEREIFGVEGIPESRSECSNN